jgi:hypothetical protein
MDRVESVHVGGSARRSAVVGDHRVGFGRQFTLAVVPDGKQHVLVGLQEMARYPFTLVARRVELASLR